MADISNEKAISVMKTLRRRQLWSLYLMVMVMCVKHITTKSVSWSSLNVSVLKISIPDI